MPRQFYISDEERLAKILKQQARSLSDVQRPTGTEREQTLARLQSAVAELDARKSQVFVASNLAVTGSATVNPFPSAVRELEFSAPAGGTRSGVLTVSGLLTNSGSPSNAVQAFVEILLRGSRVWAGEASVPRMTSAPAGWSEQISATVTIRAEANTPPPLSVRMYRVGFTSASTTLLLSDLTATLAYGAML